MNPLHNGPENHFDDASDEPRECSNCGRRVPLRYIAMGETLCEGCQEDRDAEFCYNCIHFSGTETSEYHFCPVIRMEVSSEATCTRFEAKAFI